MKTKTLDVVMIATNSKTNLLLSAFNTLFLSPPMEVKNTDKYQSLCFTSNDKLQGKNDWLTGWVTDGKTISQVIYLNVDDSDMDEYRKIEATTNPELKLYVAETLASASGYSKKTNDILIPQIPQSFIESYIKAYNEGTPILTVDVELMFQLHDGTETTESLNNRIKTTSENEVIIASVAAFLGENLGFIRADIEPKLYTKEEVVVLIEKYNFDKYNSSNRKTMFFDKEEWIKTNL